MPNFREAARRAPLMGACGRSLATATPFVLLPVATLPLHHHAGGRETKTGTTSRITLALSPLTVNPSRGYRKHRKPLQRGDFAHSSRCARLTR
ncbi:hypothetical protein GCM10022221_67570 [Actinocorallia aurea]